MGLIHCNLRVLMAERGLNIQNVKDKTTLSRTTISNLFNNLGAGIQYGTMVELCELLKCQPGDLFTYIEIKPNFEVLTKKTDIVIEKSGEIIDKEDSRYNYVESIITDLDMYCLLRYEGRNYDFTFNTTVLYGIDADKNIHTLRVFTSSEYEDNQNELKLPVHVIDFVDEVLHSFLTNWGHDFFYGNEIEGITHLTITHHKKNTD